MNDLYDQGPQIVYFEVPRPRYEQSGWLADRIIDELEVCPAGMRPEVKWFSELKDGGHPPYLPGYQVWTQKHRINGFIDASDDHPRIWLRDDLEPDQVAQTATHELAHIDQAWRQVKGADRITRSEMERQAEEAGAAGREYFAGMVRL